MDPPELDDLIAAARAANGDLRLARSDARSACDAEEAGIQGMLAQARPGSATEAGLNEDLQSLKTGCSSKERQVETLLRKLNELQRELNNQRQLFDPPAGTSW